MSLENIRQEIDEIDDGIIQLLARRQGLVQAAARHKRNEREVRAVDRQEKVIIQARANAERHGLSPDVAERVYRSMIDGFVKLELGVASEDTNFYSTAT